MIKRINSLSTQTSTVGSTRKTVCPLRSTKECVTRESLRTEFMFAESGIAPLPQWFMDAAAEAAIGQRTTLIGSNTGAAVLAISTITCPATTTVAVITMTRAAEAATAATMAKYPTQAMTVRHLERAAEQEALPAGTRQATKR